jgi:hypothetical protein
MRCSESDGNDSSVAAPESVGYDSSQIQLLLKAWVTVWSIWITFRHHRLVRTSSAGYDGYRNQNGGRPIRTVWTCSMRIGH